MGFLTVPNNQNLLSTQKRCIGPWETRGSMRFLVPWVLGILVLLSGCEGLRIERFIKVAPEDWGTLGGSTTRANQSKSVVHPPMQQVWQYDAGGGITATPLVRDNVMVVCTLKGELHAVNLLTGKRIGYLTLDGAVTGTPVWNGVVTYIPISTEDETIESVELQNGGKNWTEKLGPSDSSPLALGRYLYVTSLNGRLYCLNISDGSEAWNYKTGTDEDRQPIRSSPATDGSTIVFGCDDGFVYAVDLEGKFKWRYHTGQSVFASPVIVDGHAVVGSLDGVIYCLRLQDGNMAWKLDVGASIYGDAATNGASVFVGTSDGTCYALRASDGSIAWKFKAQSVINSAPLVADSVLYVGSLDKHLYALDIETGKEMWNFEAEGRIKVSPVIWNGTLLVTSEDSYITALR